MKQSREPLPHSIGRSGNGPRMGVLPLLNLERLECIRFQLRKISAWYSNISL